MLSLASIILSLSLIAAPAWGKDIHIIGSVQFWQRTCTEQYRCELPVAVGDRQVLSETISAPAPGSTLSAKSLTFAMDNFAGQLSVYWIKNAETSYLAGQSFLQKDGVRIAECSQYASADVATFIPVGFCAGYTGNPEFHGSPDSHKTIIQYGMTFYK